MIKKFSIAIIIVVFPLMLFAQSVELKHYLHEDWQLGTMGGLSYLATELKKDFSKATSDMNPNPAGAFSIYLNKRFKNNMTAGIEFEKNFFYSEKTFPNNINWLMYDRRFNNATSHFVAAPIYANTNTSSWFLNVGYNFLNFKNKTSKAPINLNMYLKAGIGFSSIGVEMGYLDASNYEKSKLPNPIYEKGQGIHSLKDMYLSYHAGTGINYYISPRVSVNAEVMCLLVSNDYLDGVHNYEATKLPGNTTTINRMEVYGVVAELKVGISYHFNLYKKHLADGLWGNAIEKFTNEFYFGEKAQTTESEINPK